MNITPEQWLRLKELLHAAMERPEEERDAFLEQACQGDAALLAEARAFLPGDELSAGKVIKERYRIESKLGEGGFASAYLARDIVLSDRRAVIKVLTNRKSDPYVLGKFIAEVHALAILEHPHIIAPLDHGTLKSGRPFLITQFAEGSTLRKLLETGPLPPARAGVILQQIGSALAFIHRHKVVHRDLKPENVIVQTLAGGTDHARLIDFGIATILSDQPAASTRVVGSIAYMAPEQLSGHVGALSDIYAFGALAYELLTGAVPFASNDPVEHLQMQQREDFLAPKRLRPELPSRTSELILRSLRFNPDRRPQDADALGEMIQDSLAQSDFPTETRRSARPLTWAGVVACLALALGGWSWIARQQHAVSQKVSTPPAVSALPDSAAEPGLTITLVGRQGQLFLQAADSVLPASTDFRIQVAANTHSHLYVFTESRDGETLRVLFPSSTSYRGNSSVAPGLAFSIPEKSWFHFSPAPGQEVLYFALSPGSDPDLEAAERWANEQDRGLIADSATKEKIWRTLREQSVDGSWQNGRAEIPYGNKLVVTRLVLSHL